MQTPLRQFSILVGTGILLLAAAPFTGVFAQVKSVPTDELARRAEVVAVGKVTGVQSEWNADQTMIRTRVTVSVDEFVKGNEPGGTLTLYVPGGEIGTVGEMYSHTPKFKGKEEVVVFAAKNFQGIYNVSGGSEGKFSVRRDETTGNRMVTETMSLEQLKNEVRAASLEYKGD